MSFQPTQPSLAELTDRLLKRRAVDLGVTGEPEVEPHEVFAGFRTDPRTAYTDAVLPLTLLGVKGLPTKLPPDWASVTNPDEGMFAMPMAGGLFPQQVRDLNTLLTTDDLSTLAPTATEPTQNFSSLRNWIDSNATVDGVKWLARGIGLAIGLRLEANDDETAVSRNEQATAHWLAGRHAEALNLWQTMPDSPVASFNRGMALLFTGRAAEAIPHLSDASAQLSDTSGWSHLAKLYLSIAENHRN